MSHGAHILSLIEQIENLPEHHRVDVLFAALYQNALERNVTPLRVLRELTDSMEETEEDVASWEQVRTELVIMRMDLAFRENAEEDGA